MKIEEIREALEGMTLPEIAEGSGVSARAVFSFVHGENVPTHDTIVKLQAFVDPDQQIKAMDRFDAAIHEARAAMRSVYVGASARAERAERELAKLRAAGGL